MNVNHGPHRLIALQRTVQHVEKFVRPYRRAKRAEEIERADARHENRGLTFWREDDGTVALHGRFLREMGARIPSALDAAMAAHEKEQPTAGCGDEGSVPEDVPRGTSRRDVSPAGAATGADAGEPDLAPQQGDAGVVPSDVPRGTFLAGPSRTARRADAPAWMTEQVFESSDAPALSPNRNEIVVHVETVALSNGGARRCEFEHRTAIATEAARRLCCDAGILLIVDGPQRRAAQCWAPHPQHSPRRCAARLRTVTMGAASPAARHPAPPWPPFPALGRRRRDLARQPRPPLPDPSPTGARGRLRRAAPRRRCVPVHQPLWSCHPSPAAAGGLIARHHRPRERIPRSRHRLRHRHCALAR